MTSPSPFDPPRKQRAALEAFRVQHIGQKQLVAEPRLEKHAAAAPVGKRGDLEAGRKEGSGLWASDSLQRSRRRDVQ
jgi:hypothetical protein